VDPLAFLARVLVPSPDPGHVTTRDDGCYANRPRGIRGQAESAALPPALVPAPRRAPTDASRRWASLLQQNFEADPLACPTCHGPLRVVACITQASVIDRILAHLRTTRRARGARRGAEPPIDAGPHEPGRLTRAARRRRPDRPLRTAPSPRHHAGRSDGGGRPTGATEWSPPASPHTGTAVLTAHEARERVAPARRRPAVGARRGGARRGDARAVHSTDRDRNFYPVALAHTLRPPRADPPPPPGASRMSVTRSHLRRAVSLLLAIAGAAPTLSAQRGDSTRAVLVTGASSGIGRAIAERLAKEGFRVYAGARSSADLAALGAIANVTPVRLDVTSPTDIAAAVATVTRAGGGLYGVVNNAGVVGVAPLIEMDDAEMERVLAVNLWGPFRITRAFAPLVLASRGRVVNIGSLNGFIASPLAGAYSMSKHAIEAFGDGLGAELAPFGVRVSTVEPGSFGTDIWRNLLARTDTSAIAASRFAPQMRRMLSAVGTPQRETPPDAVADAVLDALTSATPRHRYMVVPSEPQAALTLRTLLSRVAELNESQAFRYNRDDLVRMLDSALVRQGRR